MGGGGEIGREEEKREQLLADVEYLQGSVTDHSVVQVEVAVTCTVKQKGERVPYLVMLQTKPAAPHDAMISLPSLENLTEKAQKRSSMSGLMSNDEWCSSSPCTLHTWTGKAMGGCP